MNYKDIVRFVKRCALTVGGLYLFNKAYSLYAVRNHALKADSENYYPWKDLKIYTSKKGEGSPVILLHALQPTSSSYEWNLIEEDLAKNHTVYTIDLPGCGRSDKPRLHYTNFLYVSLLKEFIHSNELEDVTVVASNLSSAIPVMTNAYEPNLIKKIILISPPSIKELAKTPNFVSKIKMGVLNLPIIGSLFYNFVHSRSNIDLAFTENYFYNPFHDNDELVDIYFEASQLNSGNGHYLYASQIGNYLNIDVRYAVSNSTTPMKIIEGASSANAEETVFEWKSLQRNIKSTMINHTRQFPHLEEPDAVVTEIENFI